MRTKMKNDLFNSTFEMGLRIATLLSVDSKRCYSVTRILAIDFISCYAYAFGFSDNNLHGDNPYMYSEISSRRTLIQEAVKNLVLRGIVDVRVDGGYYYQIKEKGITYVFSFESEYATEYRMSIEKVISELCDYTDEELMKMIQFKRDAKKED